MVEIIDNGLQLAVTIGGTIWAGIFSFRHKSQNYFLLACFYGAFALGLLFWLLYLIIMTYTPKIFYVSDLSWIASFLFLLLLDMSVTSKEERSYKTIVPWFVVALLFGLTVFLCFWGDYVTTILWCGLITGCSYFSTKGLVYARRQGGEQRRMQTFHIAILFVVFSEFALWTISCYFKGSTIANPYFWCDFILTIGLFFLLPAMRKSVIK